MQLAALTEGARRFERWVSIAALALMSALPLIEIAGRRLAGGGIPGSIPVVQHLTLWITFLGAALAAASGRLIALSTASFLPDPWQSPVRLVTAACGAAVSGCLLVASLDLVNVQREAGDFVGWGIPVWVAMSIMPLGFGLVAGRLIWRSSGSWKGRLAAACGLAVPVLVFLYRDAAPAGLLLPGSLVILAATALGLPIFAALGGVALLFFWGNGVPIAAVPSETYRLSASPMLPAIPLFTLGGYLLSEGGASRRLMRTFTAMVGWMPGGLAIVTALLLAFFTPFTGASGVTILSMGGLLLPMLLKARYPEPASVGLVTVSGSIGLLFPPSLPVILYGIYAQTPIDRLFIAGLVPGLLLVLVVAGWGAWRGWSAGAERAPFSGRELLSAAWDAKWELLLPVVVLTGIFGGFATLVEAAALTVLYALVVECFVYRDLSVWRDLPRIAVECSTLAGGFLIILGAALGFTNYMIHAEIPSLALGWVRLHIQSPLLFLLALNAFLLVVGMLMDIYSAILVIVPLITPMGLAYGIDPVHLGIVFLANMELGYLTPPVGANLFLSSYRFKQPLGKIFLATLPYSLMLLGTVLLITYLPYLFGR
ncbi:MAG TPA: TRAP transporter large permease subunit [Bryobacteraceae bacterium]|nr:TRAP transporter large permease subunit [Bryobacteraceae bacterium]